MRNQNGCIFIKSYLFIFLSNEKITFSGLSYPLSDLALGCFWQTTAILNREKAYINIPTGADYKKVLALLQER
jgi:hypothetical protein